MATVRRRKARDVTGQVNCLYSLRFIRLHYLINCEANGIKKSGFWFTFMLFVSSVNSGLGVGRERVSRLVFSVLSVQCFDCL